MSRSPPVPAPSVRPTVHLRSVRPRPLGRSPAGRDLISRNSAQRRPEPRLAGRPGGRGRSVVALPSLGRRKERQMRGRGGCSSAPAGGRAGAGGRLPDNRAMFSFCSLRYCARGHDNGARKHSGDEAGHAAGTNAGQRETERRRQHVRSPISLSRSSSVWHPSLSLSHLQHPSPRRSLFLAARSGGDTTDKELRRR